MDTHRPWWLERLDDAILDVIRDMGDELKREFEETGETVDSSSEEFAEEALEITSWAIELRLEGFPPESLRSGQRNSDIRADINAEYLVLSGDQVAVVLLRRVVNGLPAMIERLTCMRAAIFSQTTPPEVRSYVVQASECYLFGMYQAAAVLSRTALEEALTCRLGRATQRPRLDDLIRDAGRDGMLSAEVNRWAPKIQSVGNDAAHGRHISEEDAQAVVASMRHLTMILYPCVGV